MGCGSNILLARLATYKAKPNGSFWVDESRIEEFLDPIPVTQLPGIGWHHQEKLSESGILCCGELRKLSLQLLKKDFGAKTGEMMYKYSRGIDDRELENKGRQSLGVDINWGVRFQNQTQVSDFFKKITEYVCDRLQVSKLKASHITVKAKRRLYKGEPGKFLGCGHCENLSKSTSMPSTDNSDSLFKIGYPLFCRLSVEPADLRGIGLSVKIFDHRDSPKKTGDRQETILKFLSPVKAIHTKKSDRQSSNNLDQVDPDVFDQLPMDIQEEIRNSNRFSISNSNAFEARHNAQDQYNKHDLFATPQVKSKRQKNRKLGSSSKQMLDSISPELTSNPGRFQMSDMLTLPSEYDPLVFKELPSSIQRELRQAHETTRLKSKKELDINNLMPSSSQLDRTVLDQLPDSIKKEVLDSKYKKRRDSIFVQKLRGAQGSIYMRNISAIDNLQVSDTPYPSLAGETDPFAIYQLLNEWITSTPDAPQEEGVSELKNYLRDLAAVGDLVRIRNLLLYLERRLSSVEPHNPSWSSAYFQIYKYITQVILDKFGARLEMKI